MHGTGLLVPLLVRRIGVRTRLAAQPSIAAAAIAAIVGGPRLTFAGPPAIHNLGTLGGASTGRAINDAGEVAGLSANGSAFRYTGSPGAGGLMQDLGTLGGSTSEAYAVNDPGQVVGLTTTADDFLRAFRYTGTPGAGGAMLDLGTLGGAASSASGINGAGSVVGYSELPGGDLRAFLYVDGPAGGTMHSLGTLGGRHSSAQAINDAGQITGISRTPGDAANHAFLYSGTPGVDGAMVDIGTLGGTSAQGNAINSAGHVAGESSLAGNGPLHAFRYAPGASPTAMVDLGTLGGSESAAFDLNDPGFVVGRAQRAPAAGGERRAALWTPTNAIVDLDAWLDAANPAAGSLWTLTFAWGINDDGLITGSGTYNDGPDGLPDGTRAFVLDAAGLVASAGTFYWDPGGPGAPGAGGPAPGGAWDGAAAHFNSDPAGGAAGITLAATTAATEVVFAAGADGGGAYAVTVSGTQSAHSVSIARGSVSFAGGTLATGRFDVAAGASANVTSVVTGGTSSALTKAGPGTLTLAVANTHTGGTTVAAGTLVAAHANALNTGQALTVGAGATARVQSGVATAIDVGALTIAPAGRVDLNDGALVKRNGGSGAAGQTATRLITAALKSGLEHGGNFDWLGNGISSTEAAADNAAAGSVLYGLGVVQNHLAVAGSPDGTTTDATPGGEIYTTFKGRTVALNDTLARYTYMGDADLNGVVNSTDYSLIDAGFGADLSGWINGDFDYSGDVDSTDYALIDNAFGAQVGPLGEQFPDRYAEHAALLGQEYVDAFAAVRSGVVPEPAALSVLALGGLTTLRRRRRAATSHVNRPKELCRVREPAPPRSISPAFGRRQAPCPRPHAAGGPMRSRVVHVLFVGALTQVGLVGRLAADPHLTFFAPFPYAAPTDNISFVPVPTDYNGNITHPHDVKIFGLSGDGSTAVGVLSSTSIYNGEGTFGALNAPYTVKNSEAISIRDGVIRALETPVLNGYRGGVAVSANYDGSVIVGSVKDGQTSGGFVDFNNNTRAAVWSGSNRTLTTLPGDPLGVARGVTNDGRIVVGELASWDGAFLNITAAKWVDGGPPTTIGPPNVSAAVSVSGDGTVIGLENGGAGRQMAISADNRTIVGSGYYNPTYPFDSTVGAVWRYNDSTGAYDRTLYSSGPAPAEFTDVNSDGTVIVGSLLTVGNANFHTIAHVMTPEHGIMEFTNWVYQETGFSWPGMFATGLYDSVITLNSVSDDGRIFAGFVTENARTSGAGRDMAFILDLGAVGGDGTYYWDITGPATPGGGGAAPTGTWDGAARNFNSNVNGADGGVMIASTTAGTDVVFSAASDGGGTYTVTVSGTQHAASVRVARGDVTFAGAGTIAAPSFEVAGGATATLGAGLGTSAGLTVTVNAGATLRKQTGAPSALDVAALNVNAAGRVDLNDSALVKRNGGSGAAGQTATRQITALLKKGLENGGNFDWLGNGISSTEAAADNATAGSVLFGLGVVQNNLAVAGSPDGTTTDETAGNTIFTTFKGRAVGLNDTLVRYTYMGDADLDGAITGTDYSLIDAGFGADLSGWINGDFDYSGDVDSTDYALIDNAFGAQTGVLPEQVQAMIARHAALFGQGYVDALARVQSGVVPEPATMGVVALAGLAMAARRRGRCRP